MTTIDYVALAPLFTAGGAALLVFLADLFVPAVTRWLAVLGALAVAGVGLGMVHQDRGTFCGTGATKLPGGVTLGRTCSYQLDHFTVYFTVACAAAAAVALLVAVPDDRVPPGEYGFLLLSSLAGMVAIAGARDFVMLIVALETLSIPVFVLAGLRRTDPRSAEAAVKFFLVSVICTAVSLLGIALLYGLTGTLSFDGVSESLAARHDLRTLPLTSAAVVLTLVALAFKVSAVPFHFWVPDTYQGAPISVAVYLSTASKAAGFAGLLLVTLRAFGPYADLWGGLLAVLATATMTVGNLVALRQRSAVRLLAWSSVAQAGYVLAPLGVAATAAGRRHLTDAVSATLVYLAIYLAMNAGAFACVAAVGRGGGPRAVEDYRGLAGRRRGVSLALAFFLLCLAGLPPGLAGLFAKIAVFRALVGGGAGWLAVVMAVNTVVGLYYYLRLASLPFAPDERGREAIGLPVGSAVAMAVGVSLVTTLVFSVAPETVFGPVNAVLNLR
ncbi:MAG: NADH-quinone oxidoreductase subunit N [Mycobacteriales bacterium]